MTLGALALVLAIGLVGPLLGAPTRFALPVVVGEILVGVAAGKTGLGWVHPDEPVLEFLATAGFALVMLVAGSHVPVRDRTLGNAFRRGALLAVLTGVLSVPAGWGVAVVAGTGHGPLYAVLLASSSAALVMPVIHGGGLTGPAAVATVAQVAIADTAAIVALPLAENPGKAVSAAFGALAVIAAGVVIWAVMVLLVRRRVIRPLQKLSKSKHFGLELRWNLIILFGLGGLAQQLGVSVMLAGFVTGLILAALGEPRRLAKQLFSVSDGFLGPVFFVWLGASLDLRALADHPVMLLVAALLAIASSAVHAATGLIGQPLPLALLSGAQLGVPVAAVTIGTRNGLLAPGEGGAILAAALISVMVTSVAARRAAATLAVPTADHEAGEQATPN